MLCTLALIMAGCTWWNETVIGTGSAQEADYNQLVAQAENEIKLADKAGFLWRDTEKTLKDSKEAKINADKARKEGDKTMADAAMANAVKLANKAIKEAQLAQQQARDNANPVARFQ
jgi:hypothetical protein